MTDSAVRKALEPMHLLTQREFLRAQRHREAVTVAQETAERLIALDCTVAVHVTPGEGIISLVIELDDAGGALIEPAFVSMPRLSGPTPDILILDEAAFLGAGSPADPAPQPIPAGPPVPVSEEALLEPQSAPESQPEYGAGGEGPEDDMRGHAPLPDPETARAKENGIQHAAVADAACIIVPHDVEPVPIEAETARPDRRRPQGPAKAAQVRKRLRPNVAEGGGAWTPGMDQRLIDLKAMNWAHKRIADDLGRSVRAVELRLLRLRKLADSDAAARAAAAPPPAPPPLPGQAKPKAELGIDQHLDKLGNSKVWTPQKDLALALMIRSGSRYQFAAERLNLGSEDVEARWQALCPNRAHTPTVKALVDALVRRAQPAAGPVEA